MELIFRFVVLEHLTCNLEKV